LQRRFQFNEISCFIPDIFAIESQSCPKFGPNFDVLAPKFFKVVAKFLTQFHNGGTYAKMRWRLSKRARNLKL